MELDLSQLIGGPKHQGSVEDDEIQTDLNSLFVTDDEISFEVVLPEELQPLVGVQSVPIKLPRSKYTLYYAEFDHESSEQHVILEKLRRCGNVDTIEIRIDSPGGSIFEGYKVYNIVKEHFNGRSTSYIDGIAYSMGAFLFLACDKRVVYETSSFMLHDFSGGDVGKGGEMRDSLDHASRLIKKVFKKTFVGGNFLSEQEFIRMMDDGKQWWMDTEEMCLRGVATHVIVEDTELTAEEYIDYVESGLSLEDYLLFADEIDDAEDDDEDLPY